jgi:hypothetical protein
VLGWSGSDILEGGAGNDHLLRAVGDDILRGEADDDTSAGGGARDGRVKHNQLPWPSAAKRRGFGGALPRSVA